MDLYLVSLRIVHILAGAFWVGASSVFVLFLEPTAAQLGPVGGAFMGHLSVKKRLPIVIAIVSLIALLSGGLLYWRTSGGLNVEWLRSATGIGFTTGAVFAVASWLVGFTVMRPGIDRMAVLGERVASGDTTAQAELEHLQHRLSRSGKVTLGLVLVAATAMASARYLR